MAETAASTGLLRLRLAMTAFIPSAQRRGGMVFTTMSGQQFDQDIEGAKRAAAMGPVVVIDRGRPAFVLQRYEDWQRQTGAKPGLSLLDALADPAGLRIEFDPSR